MHYRVLLSCLVLGAGIGACSGSSAPQSSATGGAAASSGGSNVLASGGTGGSIDSTDAPPGGTAGGGLSGNAGTIGTGTGETSIDGTGGAGIGGTGSAGSTAGSTTLGGSGTAGTAGSNEVGTGGNGGSTGGTNSNGGRISTGGTASGGTAGTGSRVGTGGVIAGGGSNGGQGGTGGTADPSTLPSITVHLAGDSTMANYASTTTQEGWGQEFGQFFISKVTIDNQAQGGANVQTFYAGKWKTLIANLRAGDYVLAAFGINDSGTTHGPVSVPNFTAEFKTMADEVAAKKATFIPTTSSPLQAWVGGKETNDRLQPYCDAITAAGQAKGLLVDDLNARGIEYYNSIGQSAAAALTYNGDKAHFNKAGATAMAQLAAKELKRIGSPLAAYLK